MSGFHFKPAVRERVHLLIGLAGGSGSGKTFSAMRIAKGLSGGKRFCVIDSERGRAQHYAGKEFGFEFDHGALDAPFRPEHYIEAIDAAESAGYGVIVVDCVSHEWYGEGGVLDWAEEELERMAGDDWRKRESCKLASFIRPKMSHKRFVQRLLQVNAHLVLLFRAEPKVEMVREDGKTKIVPKESLIGYAGWIPVSEKSMPFELTVSLMLTPDAPGIPKPIKLQEQHRPFVPLDRILDESVGVELGKWAMGSDDARHTRMDDFRLTFASLATEEAFNDMAQAIKDEDKVVKGLLVETARMAGFVYDKPSKGFIRAPKEFA